MRITSLINQSSSFGQLVNWLVRKFWIVHSSTHLRLTIQPSQAYRVLEVAMKPSVKRLGLRKLFVQGRRYFIRSTSKGGFQMMTSNKVWWHPKRRTTPSTILTGNFEKLDDTLTRITLRSRIRLRYLLSGLLWPSFITSMIIFLDWHTWIIALCIVALYTSSWLTRRYNAMLEAYEITYFIETVLSDFSPAPPKILSNEGADIVMEQDFATEWDKFVEAHHND